MQEIKTEFHPGEIIVKESRADWMRGAVEQPGKLWLTNQRLIFKSGAGAKPDEWSIALAHIASAERGSPVSGPVVVVKLRDGKQEQFRVTGSDDWIARIAAARTGTLDATVMSLPAASADDTARTIPIEGLPSGPPPAAKPPSTAMLLLTRLSRSPFAGQERPPTAEMQLQLDRQRRSLLLVVLLGLACIVAGGCALFVLMLAMS